MHFGSSLPERPVFKRPISEQDARQGKPRRPVITILLDHAIVPSRDPGASAGSLAGLLDVAWQAAVGHFTPVYINETLTLDFDRAGVIGAQGPLTDIQVMAAPTRDTPAAVIPD